MKIVGFLMTRLIYASVVCVCTKLLHGNLKILIGKLDTFKFAKFHSTLKASISITFS